MKVIEEGIPLKQEWWVGRRVKCKTCERVVELQEGDEYGADVIACDGHVSVSCVKCLTMNTIMKG